MIKIALLGFGTVASGVPFLLEENASKIEQAIGGRLEIAKVLVKDEMEKQRLVEAGHDYHFVTDVAEIMTDQDIAIVVELMGRIEPAKTFISQALSAGKHVVSANKDLIAVHGKELLELADQYQVGFYYEAAVAGGIPILRTLANSLTADKVTRLLGVLNGTSNFMLTKMVDEGWSYEQALATAQELGYAESDPTNDVEGIDAAYKAAILSQFGFGMTVDFDTVRHSGISTITPADVTMAQQLGYVIKLVGDVRETASGLSVEVAPTFLPKSHPLASVNGVMNAVFVESIGIGHSMFYGPGAGQKPTAVSVVADLVKLGRAITDGQVISAFNGFVNETRLAQPEDVTNSYYFALSIKDEAGQFFKLAQLFAQENISFQQVLQTEGDGETARVVIVTHEMSLVQLDRVRAQIAAAGQVTLLNHFKVLGV